MKWHGLLIVGLYATFYHFWQGLDLITGDEGDARFNAVVLEHTWLWLNGVHESLFNLPMYAPHPNVYAYSDFHFATAPLYWGARALGAGVLVAFQAWLMSGMALSYFVYVCLVKRWFGFSHFYSAIAAFVFTFALPKVTHLEHAQMMICIWPLVSFYGLTGWLKDPRSRVSIVWFVSGGTLQLISSFYGFWYWLWCLAVFKIYFLSERERERRAALRPWLARIPWRSAVAIVIACGWIAFPFVAHYVKAAGELPPRGWGSISYTLPRLQSWILLPTWHWEWQWLPFKAWLLDLPMIQEHYLSFGLMTWIFAWIALVWAYRQTRYRVYSIPIFVMFALTLSVGRVSLWAFMTYFFPGGSVIRAVGRIQIFMLAAWATVIVLWLREQASQAGWKRWMPQLFLIVFSLESLWPNPQVFSQREEQKRVDAILQSVPTDCRSIQYVGPAILPDYVNQLDAVRAAFASGRSTVNGYSGNQPPGYGTSASGLELWVKNNPVAGLCRVAILK